MLRAGVALDSQRIQQRLFGAEESHRQQHELGGNDAFRAGNIFWDELALFVSVPLDFDGMDGFDVAMFVALEFGGGGEVNARVGAIFRGGFLLAVIHLVNLGPFGPWVVGGAIERRLRQNLDLDDATAAVTERSADAIGAGIAAADDDHVAVLRGDEAAVGSCVRGPTGCSR